MWLLAPRTPVPTELDAKEAPDLGCARFFPTQRSNRKSAALGRPLRTVRGLVSYAGSM